jgi:hypothetical protein
MNDIVEMCRCEYFLMVCRLTLLPTSGGLAQGGEYKSSRGCERLNVRQDFLRTYTPPCAKNACYSSH